MLPENRVYDNYVKALTRPSPKAKDFILAFLTGGTICVIGQTLMILFDRLGASNENVKILVPSTLVFFTALLTGIGIFDKIAKHAGAGTLVPITGFANAVASPAIEFKNEGFILGVGANLFKIAGPVIAYGTLSSVIYGIILYIVNMAIKH